MRLWIDNKSRLAWLGVTIFVLALPFVFGEGFYLNILNFIALYAMVAVGLCLLTGYAGQLSISHSAFFAIGGYASAIISMRCHLPPLVTIVLAQGLSALIAWGIGAVVLRLKGHYLAIATLSFTMIVQILIKEMNWLTDGLQGLISIPQISLGRFVIDSDYRFYFLAWPIALLILWFSLNLADSRMGRIFRTIKEDEDVASLFGASVKKYKTKLYILSSVFASLAGSLYAHFVTFLSPEAASLMFGINIIMVLAFGGFNALWGAMIGVASLTFLNQGLAGFADYKQAIYGLALIVIMLFFPNGLLLGLKDLGSRALHVVVRGGSR